MRKEVLALVIVACWPAGGCGNECEYGETWCEGDEVMICVAARDPAEAVSWKGTDQDGSWDFVELLDCYTVAVVDVDCGQLNSQCEESRDDGGRMRAACK